VFAIYGVPVFAPVAATEREDLGGASFGPEWIKGAVARLQERIANDYWPPVHLGHQSQSDPTDNRPFGGFLDRPREEQRLLDGVPQPTLVVDLVDIPAEVFQQIQSGRWSYRSIEIRPPYQEVSSLALLSTVPPHHKFGVLALGDQVATFAQPGKLALGKAIPATVEASAERAAAAIQFQVGSQCAAGQHLRVKPDKEKVQMADDKYAPKPGDGVREAAARGKAAGARQDIDYERRKANEGKRDPAFRPRPPGRFADEPEDDEEILDGEGAAEGGEEMPPDATPELPPAAATPAPPAAPAQPTADPGMQQMLGLLGQIAQALGIQPQQMQGGQPGMPAPGQPLSTPAMPATVNPVTALQAGGIAMTPEERKRVDELATQVEELKAQARKTSAEARVRSDVVQLAQEGRAIDIEAETTRLLEYARLGGEATYKMRLEELRQSHPAGAVTHRALTFAQSFGGQATLTGNTIPPALRALHAELGATSKAFEVAALRFQQEVDADPKARAADVEATVRKALRVRRLVEETKDGRLVPTQKGQ